MNKFQARAQLLKVAGAKGYSVKFALSKTAGGCETVTILNSSTRKPVKSGILKINANGGYLTKDFTKVLASIKGINSSRKLNASKDAFEDFPDYEADVDGAAFSETLIELMESYGFEDAYEEPSIQNGSGTDFISGTLKGKDYSFKKDYYDEVALIMDLGPEEAAQWVFEEFLKKIGLNSSRRRVVKQGNRLNSGKSCGIRKKKDECIKKR